MPLLFFPRQPHHCLYYLLSDVTYVVQESAAHVILFVLFFHLTLLSDYSSKVIYINFFLIFHYLDPKLLFNSKLVLRKYIISFSQHPSIIVWYFAPTFFFVIRGSNPLMEKCVEHNVNKFSSRPFSSPQQRKLIDFLPSILLLILVNDKVLINGQGSLVRSQEYNGGALALGSKKSGSVSTGGEIMKSPSLNLHEPSCEELRAMWQFSKRQSRASEITNEIPTYHDPFTYNVWDPPYYPTTTRSMGG